MELPPEIVRAVQQLFPVGQQTDTLRMLEGVFSCLYGMQCVRSLVFLSAGKYEVLQHYLRLWKSDPRDLISSAEVASGNFGHYMSIPLSEVAQVATISKQEALKWGELEEKLPADFWVLSG